jgi:protein-disulfide isomerase
MRITERDHVAGAEDAPLTLVEYGDYMSADCKPAHDAIMTILDTHPGLVRYVYRHYVHDRVNKQGFVAAMAAEATAVQGYFWEIHAQFVNANGALSSAEVVAIASDLGLEIPKFLRDISRKTFSSKIKEDLESGAVNGVVSVPTFFLNGVRMVGAFNPEKLIRAVGGCL